MRLAHPLHWPRLGLIALVKSYRLLLKPWLGNACRFEPTCSAYALQALQLHGATRGSALAGWRIVRCHPWCAGGIDPVPGTVPVSDDFSDTPSVLLNEAASASALGHPSRPRP
jgi:putative membrane protein insertion efficiency factor